MLLISEVIIANPDLDSFEELVVMLKNIAREGCFFKFPSLTIFLPILIV
jgi:hypothetical protein